MKIRFPTHFLAGRDDHGRYGPLDYHAICTAASIWGHRYINLLPPSPADIGGGLSSLPVIKAKYRLKIAFEFVKFVKNTPWRVFLSQG